MKQIITAIFCLIFLSLFFSCTKNSVNPSPTGTDSFMVTLNNGYGGGQYKTGDTVHVFSSAWTTNQLFGKWSGDISFLQAPDEWHTWFIMPDKNVTVTGQRRNHQQFYVAI